LGQGESVPSKVGNMGESMDKFNKPNMLGHKLGVNKNAQHKINRFREIYFQMY
jgi:hypothetical protein